MDSQSKWSSRRARVHLESAVWGTRRMLPTSSTTDDFMTHDSAGLKVRTPTRDMLQ